MILVACIVTKTTYGEDENAKYKFCWYGSGSIDRQVSIQAPRLGRPSEESEA